MDFEGSLAENRFTVRPDVDPVIDESEITDFFSFGFDCIVTKVIYWWLIYFSQITGNIKLLFNYALDFSM